MFFITSFSLPSNSMCQRISSSPCHSRDKLLHLSIQSVRCSNLLVAYFALNFPLRLRSHMQTELLISTCVQTSRVVCLPVTEEKAHEPAGLWAFGAHTRTIQARHVVRGPLSDAGGRGGSMSLSCRTVPASAATEDASACG